MNKLTIMKRTNMEELLGGKIRFAILEALAEAKQPMTAYQIAMAKGLDPAATYRYLTEFSEFGVVQPGIKGRKQTSYRLSDRAGKAALTFLRSLKQKPSEPIDLEEWMAPAMQAERTAKMVRLGNQINNASLGRPLEEKEIDELMSRRAGGELSALVASSQIAFSELFELKKDVFVLKEK